MESEKFRRIVSGGIAVLGAAALTTLGVQAPAQASGQDPTVWTGTSSRANQNRLDLTLPPEQLSRHAPTLARPQATAPHTEAATASWASVPDFPTQIQDNVVGYNNGTLYSVGGWTGTAATTDMYSYTPGDSGWTKRASAPTLRTTASGAFIGGKFYVTDGWASAVPTDKTEIYDPVTDRWTTGAPSPKPVAAAATAVLNGKLYTVGGCNATICGATTNVEVYNPQTNTWSAAANYPVSVAFAACGAIEGKLYCAGGISKTATLTFSR